MKKLFLTLTLSAIAFIGFSQNLLTYQINAKVLLSNGDSIPAGAVCSFNAHVENVGATGKIAYDINWYYNASAKTNSLDKVFACTSGSNRMATRLVTYYQTVSDPTQVTYDSMKNALKTYLESIYGSGNVQVL